MTQQEEQLLNGLIQRVNGTQLQTKDDEAERLLQTSFARNPDALYILCQTVLVQQFAMEKTQGDLEAARAEIQRLQQAGGGEKHGSFLGNLLGLNKDEPASRAPVQTQPQYGAPAGYQPVPNAPQAQAQYGYPPQQPGYPTQGGYYQQAPPMGGGVFGGGGGFLQGAMQTAAGVVAGEMAFRALEDVFSSGHGGRGFEGGGEVVNNYYDDAGSRDGGGFGDRLASADGYDGGVSSDIEDRRGDSHGFFDGGDAGGADSFADDAGASDDDAGSFDDGGDFGSGDDN